MKMRLILGTFIILLHGAVGCGPVKEEERLPVSQPETRFIADENPEIPVSYYETDGQEELPLETFLVDGNRLNSRVTGASASFVFASNREDASFECAVGKTAAYEPCQDKNRLTLKGLQQGRSYRVNARAVLPSGQKDATPLVVEILADALNGGPLYTSPYTTPRHQVRNVSDLPWQPSPTDTTGGGTPEQGSSELLLGELDLMIPPRGMMVTSFASEKSLAMSLLTFRLAEDPNAGCLSWERLVQHPLGPWYCEGYPREDDLLKLERPIARNHVLLERRGANITVQESLYAASLAASGEEQVGTEFATTTLCAQATNQGSAEGPRFPSLGEAVGGIQWCTATRADGQQWWIARWDDDNNRPAGSKLLAVYTVNASRSRFFAAEQFLRRARQIMTTAIVPTGQTRY